MAQKENTKQNNPIPLNELSIQRIEDITKQIIAKPDNLFDELNKQIIDSMNKDRKDAQYSKEQVLQMRENNDRRLYKTPEAVNCINAGGYVWENGKVGYFIPFEHRALGGDFLQPQFGGGQKDGKGLRFVQIHKDSNKRFAFPQSNDIIISGFGEYVLENWGKDLSKLCDEYDRQQYRKCVEQWRKDNYPQKVDRTIILQLLNELKETEQNKWRKATISEFLTSNDYNRLQQCMNEYFNSVDSGIEFERNREERTYINRIKSGTFIHGDGWVNGKAGSFKDVNKDCQYRFVETTQDGCSLLTVEREWGNLPVVFYGFVAWLIKHWGEGTQTIYLGYLQARLNQYKDEHKNDADVFKRDLEREFYDQYRAKEEQWVKQSEAIFDFISEPEVNKIKEYVQNYFEYVKLQTPKPKAAEQTKEEIYEDTGKQQRTINAEKLKPYFNSTFKGIGNNNINYFEWLINHLQTDRTPKAFAQIALMIYESQIALNNTKPNTFKGWYSIFCESISCEQKTYKKNQLKNPPEQITKIFNYL